MSPRIAAAISHVDARRRWLATVEFAYAELRAAFGLDDLVRVPSDLENSRFDVVREFVAVARGELRLAERVISKYMEIKK